LVLIVGITIGALFYPTKRIEEKITKKYEQEISSLKESHSKEVQSLSEKYDASMKESLQYHKESEQKILKLTTEIHTLQSHQKTSYFKVVLMVL
jgi:HSP90 family molecular chaperone